MTVKCSVLKKKWNEENEDEQIEKQETLVRYSSDG